MEERKTQWKNGAMAVNLKNLEAERLLKELAELAGESLTKAATRAFSRFTMPDPSS
jgi:Rv0623-like transcription factor